MKTDKNIENDRKDGENERDGATDKSALKLVIKRLRVRTLVKAGECEDHGACITK
jgi:hypothetical protein